MMSIYKGFDVPVNRYICIIYIFRFVLLKNLKLTTEIFFLDLNSFDTVLLPPPVVVPSNADLSNIIVSL